jgi:hypothetical protein
MIGDALRTGNHRQPKLALGRDPRLNYRVCHAKAPSARFRNRGFVRWRDRSAVILTTHAPFTTRCCSLAGNSGSVGRTSLSLRYRNFSGHQRI